MKNYVKLLIEGKNPLYFLDRLYKQNIDFEVLRNNSTQLVIKVNDYQFNKIKKMTTSYKINIIGQYGIKNIYYRFKYNVINSCALLVFLMIIFFLSYVIFDIKIITTNKQLVKAIQKYNNEIGFRKFTLMFNVESIENKIKQHFNEQIEWMEIEKHGTKYVINIEERKHNPIISNKPPTNIVASQNAVIKKVIASRGDIVVVNNQYVNKGEIIVSGIIRHNEQEKARVAAQAIVYGEVWVKAKIYMPLIYQEKEFLKSKRTWSINFINYKLYLFSKPYNKNKVTIIKQIKHPLIPVSFSMNKNTKYHESIYLFNEQEAIIYGSEKIDQQIKKGLNKNEYIISKKQLKVKSINSKMYIEVFYRLYRRIDKEVVIK